MTRILVILLVAYCCVSHVEQMVAPPGWYVGYARPDGSYELSSVLGRPQDDLDDARARRQIQGPAPVRGWLVCTGGSTIHQDGRKVWCQR